MDRAISKVTTDRNDFAHPGFFEVGKLGSNLKFIADTEKDLQDVNARKLLKAATTLFPITPKKKKMEF